LSQKNLEHRDLLAIFQAVGAVRGQSTGRFIASETIPARTLIHSVPFFDRIGRLT
jgi:hypothetical protein